jgi:hypothetical protein
MRYIGIDPGLSGGIAYVDDPQPSARIKAADLVRAFPMPKSERDILTLLQDMTEGGVLQTFAMLERVGATPQMGVVSSFTFGKGYGGLLMALAAVEIPFDQVAPVKWQNVMECRTPKERRAELGHKDKNIDKRRAEQLFPMLRVTHATADALLIADYCRRVHGKHGAQAVEAASVVRRAPRISESPLPKDQSLLARLPQAPCGTGLQDERSQRGIHARVAGEKS